MSTAALRAPLALIAVVAAAAFAAPAAAQPYAPEDDFTAVWSRAQALKINLDATNTKPRIPPDFPVMSDEVWVWDTWPLTNLGTKPVTYKGWHVIFSLVAPRSVGFPERHVIATIGYFFSRDGESWRYGGHVFPRDTALGSRQWAGSAVLTGEQVNLFYTATGKDHPVVNDRTTSASAWPMRRPGSAPTRTACGSAGSRSATARSLPRPTAGCTRPRSNRPAARSSTRSVIRSSSAIRRTIRST